MQGFETRFTGKISSINVSGIQRTLQKCDAATRDYVIRCRHQVSTGMYHKATGSSIRQACDSNMTVTGFLLDHSALFIAQQQLFTLKTETKGQDHSQTSSVMTI